MTTHFANRTLFSMALLAIFTIGTACSDDDSMKQAADKKAFDDGARELTDVARSGGDALKAEASRAADVVKAEASKLAEAARHGGVVRTAEEAKKAAQEVRDQGGTQAVAKELAENLQTSHEVYDETYEAAKKRKENALEAGG